MLFAPVHEFGDIVIRLDVLYPLENLLVLLHDVVHLTDANSVVQRGHDLVCAVIRAMLRRCLKEPVLLSHERLLACIVLRVL